ncbi:MAG: dTDP-4-amino-4,6-dideoxygalactose transaminase [Actinomycetota bacterium]
MVARPEPDIEIHIDIDEGTLTMAIPRSVSAIQAPSEQSLITFNRPSVVGRELHHVATTITRHNLAGGGSFTDAAEGLLTEMHGAEASLLVTSCTSALEMAAMLLDLGPGDEVIMPSYTFVSTALAVVRTGATPVWVDIRPDTFNLDETLIEAAITPRTRSIWPVHYAGVGCEMNRIMDIADAHDLLVVEDAAQAIGATYDGRPLGGIGPLGCISFHETKNVSCGEGGALIVNAEGLVDRAETLRDKGTNRKAFERNTVDKYSWVDLGSSYALSEILSAFLFGQLEQMDQVQAERRRVWESYRQLLRPLEARGLLQLPTIPENCTTNHHIFPIVTADADERHRLITWLADHGIEAVFHYVPLHSSPMGTKLADRPYDLPVTDRVSSSLLRLPMHAELSERDLDYITDTIATFFRRT